MHTGLLSYKMNEQRLFELIITQCASIIHHAHWVIINSKSCCPFILFDNNQVCMVDNTGAAELRLVCENRQKPTLNFRQ